LSGKGYGKEDAVFSAIQSKLSGYKKDENRSGDDDFIFTDGKKEIRIAMNSGDIVIVISAATSEEATDEEVAEVVEVVEEYGD